MSYIDESNADELNEKFRFTSQWGPGEKPSIRGLELHRSTLLEETLTGLSALECRWVGCLFFASRIESSRFLKGEWVRGEIRDCTFVDCVFWITKFREVQLAGSRFERCTFIDCEAPTGVSAHFLNCLFIGKNAFADESSGFVSECIFTTSGALTSPEGEKPIPRPIVGETFTPEPAPAKPAAGAPDPGGGRFGSLEL